MKLWLSALVERLLASPPWATCPAESFPERFAVLEQRLRAAYPPERGYNIRAWRKKDSWVVYVRKGPWAGFAVSCEPVYDAESFGPSRVSVWVGTYSRVIHLALYLLVALVTSPALVLLAKYLVPRLFAAPAALAVFWPLYLLAVCGSFLLIATVLAASERFWPEVANLDDVRALVRSVLAADEGAALPERARAGRSQRVLTVVAVGAGLLCLGVGSWSLWEWWSYWDDPVNVEALQNGVEAVRSARIVYLVHGAVLVALPLMLFWWYALSRSGATREAQNQPSHLAGPASRQAEVGSSTNRAGG
jgi:hypothetical protein